MSKLAFERGQRVIVRETGHEAEVIWSDETWTVLLATGEYPPWAQTIDTAFARERCDIIAAPAPIAAILREREEP